MKSRNLRKSFSVLAFLALICGYSATAVAWDACVDIIKEVSNDGGTTWHDANTEGEALVVYEGALYKFTVINCGGDLNRDTIVEDSLLGVYENLGTMEPGDVYSFTKPASEICANGGLIRNTASVTACPLVDPRVNDSDDAWISCEIPPPAGGEGCTPGYWKQSQHFDSWPATLAPGDSFSSIFDRVITIKAGGSLVTDPTLHEALSAQGGGVNAAARHSVAALLNALPTGVSFDLTVVQVITLFQEAYDADNYDHLINSLEYLNEQGCPLN